MQRLLQLFKSNWISTLGASLTTLAFLGIATSYVLNSLGSWSVPYQGLVLVGLLGLFVVGLVLIPAGMLVYRRTLKERMARATTNVAQVLYWLGGLTLVNFAVIGSAGTNAASHMSSVQFCGTACHQVMQPEFDTFHDSPHAGIACVDCHVGPGATWYVKSKLNGARQAWMTLRGTWHAPIPTPVHDLRSANETCGNCHSSEEYVSDHLVVRHHYDDDATPMTDVLMMNVGGRTADGSATGIHWHADPGTEVTYVHTDEARMEIPWVQVREKDGSVRTFALEGFEGDTPPEGELRRMDCVDCHNRPTHRFHGLDESIDMALASGRLDPAMPAIVPAAREVLQAEHTRADAQESIRAALARYYAGAEDGGVPADDALDAAGDTLAAIWLRNIYPERGVEWGTYPSLANHAGCLRCHDGEHADDAGEVISIDCDSCHAVLATQETEPEILELLGLGGG